MGKRVIDLNSRKKDSKGRLSNVSARRRTACLGRLCDVPWKFCDVRLNSCRIHRGTAESAWGGGRDEWTWEDLPSLVILLLAVGYEEQACRVNWLASFFLFVPSFNCITHWLFYLFISFIKIKYFFWLVSIANIFCLILGSMGFISWMKAHKSINKLWLLIIISVFQSPYCSTTDSLWWAEEAVLSYHQTEQFIAQPAENSFSKACSLHNWSRRNAHI